MEFDERVARSSCRARGWWPARGTPGWLPYNAALEHLLSEDPGCARVCGEELASPLLYRVQFVIGERRMQQHGPP